MKNNRTYKRYIPFVVIGGVAFLAVIFFSNTRATVEYVSAERGHVDTTEEVATTTPEVIPATHVQTPSAVKALYMSSCVAGTPSFRKDLVAIIDTTELNSVIIDVKDYTGKLSFVTDEADLASYLSDRCYAPDMADFIADLHKRNIYVIGRVTVFQDPYYTSLYPETAVRRESDNGIWTDRKGISYIDPGSKKAWDHTVNIAKASYDIGFDEINFDYIRFPSDGNMKDIAFPYSKTRDKADVIEDFFSYLHTKLEPTGMKTSADLFGMVAVNTDDLGIGQVLEKGFPYFDYIAPMVYPSHFPPNFNGWKDPNKVPYDLILYTMQESVARAIATSTPVETLGSTRIGTSTPALYTKEVYDQNIIRPWLQDFDYGGEYGPKEVRAQIQATYDAGLSSWMLWAPSNRYTVEALHSDE